MAAAKTPGGLVLSLSAFGLLLVFHSIEALECKIEARTTYLEQDGLSKNVIKSKKGEEYTLTRSNVECMNECFKSEKCTAWTRITNPSKLENSEGRKVGECWLLRNTKAKKLQREKNGCCSSGRGEKCASYDNTDFQGSDLKTELDIYKDWTCSFEDCRKRCLENKECKSWTWVKEPRQLLCPAEKNQQKGRLYGECWLKREQFPTRGTGRHTIGEERCCVSGNVHK